MCNCDGKDDNLDKMRDRIEKVGQGHRQGVVSVRSHTVSSHMPSVVLVPTGRVGGRPCVDLLSIMFLRTSLWS